MTDQHRISTDVGSDGVGENAADLGVADRECTLDVPLAREPDNQTRRTAYSVLAAVDRDRRALRMIAAHEADPGLVDCTPECIASAALSADQAWPWAAVAVLRWLCEPWPKDETRAEAREVE